MKVIIEKLRKRNLAEFWRVFAVLLRNDFSGYTKRVVNNFLNNTYTQRCFDYWLTTGWKEILVAKRSWKIIGFLVFDKPYGGVCFCRWLGVLPEFRKKNIGKKLIERWIGLSRDYGCHKVELASQSSSRNFYSKAGLKLEGKRRLSYFGIDQYIFGKVIAKPNDLVMIK